MFTINSQLEIPEDDLIMKCLCKLQDGLKVTTNEAVDAIKQYRKFQGETGRLQSELNRPSRVPKLSSSLYFQEKSFKERTEKIIAAKEKEIVELKNKLKEVTCRLSALVGTQVVEVDDKKSDLTDDLKIPEIAEDYRGVFDQEWQRACEELSVGMDQAKVLIYLGKISWMAFEFALDIAHQQLDELMQKEIKIIRIMSKPSYEEKQRRKPLVADGISPRKFERDETFLLLKNYRRVLARTSVPGVKRIFMQLVMRTPPVHGTQLPDGVKKYINKVVELSYLMVIQDPPMHLEYVRFGDNLDTEKFKRFKGEGDTVVGTIWPVILLHKGGPVLSRGVVDVMYSQIKTPRNVAMKKILHC